MSSRVHLPVLEQKGSLRKDGSRAFVQPADVRGRFNTLRRIGFAVLIAIYAVLPWVEVGEHPAVFLDIAERKFYLFGATFNAQDFWLAFFLLTGIGFFLIFLTAVLGRVWCGYACPQTVFLEGVYRRIERIIEGPRQARIKRNAGPARWDNVWRKGLKHGLFAVVSLLIAHVFLSYFVSLPALFEMMQQRPRENPEAFAWVAGISGLLYLNYAWFREQLCLIVCPYGRLQSVLTDDDSIVVGYDEKRGEPRGKKSDPNAGDCVDCKRCVQVCPTGIDIRDGLQLDCIGCSACVDACDEVMEKVGRPRGLIRYDSLNGLRGEKRRFFRPRLFMYAGFGLVGLLVASFALQKRTPFEANLMRMPGAPFVVKEGRVRNTLRVHLVNKEPGERRYRLTPRPTAEGMRFSLNKEEVSVPSLDGRYLPVVVTLPRERMGKDLDVKLQIDVVTDEGVRDSRVVSAPFLGPQGSTEAPR